MLRVFIAYNMLHFIADNISNGGWVQFIGSFY